MTLWKTHPCAVQVALWDLLLSYYQQQSKSNVPICKTFPSSDWERSMQCYSQTMTNMGYPYKKRSAFHVFFWSLNAWPRGFTFFYQERKTLATWKPEELYQPGDFVIHTHVDLIVQELSAFQFLKWMAQTFPEMLALKM